MCRIRTKVMNRLPRDLSFLAIAGTVAIGSLIACTGAALSVEQAGAELEGIYRLQTHTRNDAGCDLEGESVLDGEAAGFLALYTNEAMGQQFVQATACAGADDCREKAGLSRAMGTYWAAFDLVFSEPDATSLLGDEVSTGTASMSADDPCYGTVSEHRLEQTERGIRIEQRATVIDEFPKDDRFCKTEAARAAAGDSACSRLVVITAVRDGDLEPGVSR